MRAPKSDQPTSLCSAAVLKRSANAASMKIHRDDWERVLEKACDIASATETEDDPMYEIHLEAMMTLLNELESRYGRQSRILATRVDYLENASDRRASCTGLPALAGGCSVCSGSLPRLGPAVPSIDVFCRVAGVLLRSLNKGNATFL